MDRDFWLERWSKQEIGFHQPGANPWLTRLWPELGIPAGSPVFVPLCGKSLDLHWLADRGHAVVGVELAETAVRAFYEEADLRFQTQRLPDLMRYRGGQVTIFCGDFMDLTALNLPDVMAVYDRASLVALPPRMRAHYADHLLRIVPDGCRILLLTFEYDQTRVPGPPHSVKEDEVVELFGARCAIQRLCSSPVTGLPPKFTAQGVEVVEAAYSLVKHS